MLPAFVVGIVFSVPLAAIIGGYWVRVKRMEFESGAPARETNARLRALEAENRELRTRVETLETIVTMDAPRARVRVNVADVPNVSASDQVQPSEQQALVGAAVSPRRQG